MPLFRLLSQLNSGILGNCFNSSTKPELKSGSRIKSGMTRGKLFWNNAFSTHFLSRLILSSLCQFLQNTPSNVIRITIQKSQTGTL
jgi:hypothetical protein